MLNSEINKYVVSSRVRLARNVEGYNFSNKMTVSDAQKLVDEVSNPLLSNIKCQIHKLANMNDVDIMALKEKHLISDMLIQNRKGSAVVIDESQNMSIMINEEDHVRLQIIMDGLKLDEAYKQAELVDKLLSQYVKFSYSDKLGYLTACPTNLGTGLRASVMLFLPALTIANNISDLIRNVTRSHMVLRGVYGEGSKAEGFLYQLSNQQTLGVTEKEILQSVNDCVTKIIHAEEKARESLFKNNHTELCDRIGRAWGILNNCYSISSSEFEELISWVKLGVAQGIIDYQDIITLNQLTTDCKIGNFAKKFGSKVIDTAKRDEMRAEYVKKTLAKK